MSKALLIGNGKNDPALLRLLAGQADFILAADGGAKAAAEAGVCPHAVIGDLDSIPPALQQEIANKIQLIHITRQDNTDFEKALDWLSEHHFEQVTAVGFTGGRLDFTLGNFLSVYPYLDKMQLSFRGEHWTVYPLVAERTLTVQPGQRLSLLPLLPCQGLCLSGVKYPLQNASWTPGQNSGLFLSNETLSQEVHFSLAAGFVLLYVENS